MIELFVGIAALLHLSWNRLFHIKLTDPLELSRGLFIGSLTLGAALYLFDPGAFFFSWRSWSCAIVSGVLHAVYFVALLRLYRSAEFTLIYPLARAWSVCVAAFLGAFVLRETVSLAALVGISFIVLSSWALVPVSDERLSLFVLKKIRGCIAIGTLVAFVGLIDKVGIETGSPLAYCFSIFAVCALCLAAYGSRGNLRRLILGAGKFNWSEYLSLGFGIIVAYALILEALARGPLHEIAALREISLVLTLLAGVFLDGEKLQLRKTLSLAALIAGVIFVDLAA